MNLAIAFAEAVFFLGFVCCFASMVLGFVLLAIATPKGLKVMAAPASEREAMTAKLASSRIFRMLKSVKRVTNISGIVTVCGLVLRFALYFLGDPPR